MRPGTLPTVTKCVTTAAEKSVSDLSPLGPVEKCAKSSVIGCGKVWSHVDWLGPSTACSQVSCIRLEPLKAITCLDRNWSFLALEGRRCPIPHCFGHLLMCPRSTLVLPDLVMQKQERLVRIRVWLLYRPIIYSVLTPVPAIPVVPQSELSCDFF